MSLELKCTTKIRFSCPPNPTYWKLILRSNLTISIIFQTYCCIFLTFHSKVCKFFDEGLYLVREIQTSLPTLVKLSLKQFSITKKIIWFFVLRVESEKMFVIQMKCQWNPSAVQSTWLPICPRHLQPAVSFPFTDIRVINGKDRVQRFVDLKNQIVPFMPKVLNENAKFFYKNYEFIRWKRVKKDFDFGFFSFCKWSTKYRLFLTVDQTKKERIRRSRKINLSTTELSCLYIQKKGIERNRFSWYHFRFKHTRLSLLIVKEK